LTIEAPHEEFVGSHSINIRTVFHFIKRNDVSCEDIHLWSYFDDDIEIFKIEARA